MLPCDSIRISRTTKETKSPFCGPRGDRWEPLPGRSVGRKQPSPGSCSGTHSPRAGIPRFTPPEPINCAGGVKRSSNEKPLYVCGGDRLAEGWTPEQISGWLKSGNEPRLRAIGCETIYAFIYRTGQKAEALWRYLTLRHKRRRPRHARPSRDTIKDRASIQDRPETIESRRALGLSLTGVRLVLSSLQ